MKEQDDLDELRDAVDAIKKIIRTELLDPIKGNVARILDRILQNKENRCYDKRRKED